MDVEDQQPPKIKLESASTINETAQVEVAAFARLESKQRHLHYGAILLYWTFVISLLAVAGVWLFHLLTPVHWHFLPEAQRGELKTILC